MFGPTLGYGAWPRGYLGAGIGYPYYGFPGFGYAGWGYPAWGYGCYRAPYLLY